MTAFSLVEVVMAIGILSVALISMAGLFSTGLTTFRASKDTTTESQIIQYMTSAISLNSFSSLSQSTPRFFDQDGKNLTDATDRNIRFRVLTQPTAASLPGVASISTNDALCLKITIIRQAGPNGPVIATNAYAVQIANSGR